jgi:ankyrin repeat protein
VVDLLLANTAEVNARANNGGTPLRFAADARHQDVVDLLRQHGGR